MSGRWRKRKVGTARQIGRPFKVKSSFDMGYGKVGGAIWRLNNTYNSLEIKFPDKPTEEIRTKMKQAGYKWAHQSGVWYARDTPYARSIAEELADKGEDVGEKLSYAECVEMDKQRAEARIERLEGASEKAKEEATSRFDTAHKLMDVIPLGQPILVGHHSERGHRAHLARIDKNIEKGLEASDKAEELEHRAKAAERTLLSTEDPNAVARKIERFETELRRLKLHDAESKMYGRPRYDKEWFDKTTKDYEEKIAYWKQALSNLGGLRVTPEKVKVGNYVKFGGTWYKVKKVNPKTVTIEGWMGNMEWTYKLPYNDLTDLKLGVD